NGQARKALRARNFNITASKGRTLILQAGPSGVTATCSVTIMESNLQGYAPYKSNVRPGRADAVAAERAFVIAAEAARPGTPAAAGSYSAKIQSPLSYEFCPHIQPPD